MATFMGRRIAYTYEVTELVPGKRLVMRASDGPMALETTYTWDRRGRQDAEAAQLRWAERVGKAHRPIMAAAVRRATTKDLAQLKEQA